jgi:hypothetical protein
MNEAGNFDNLPELHALTCGLKALVTQVCDRKFKNEHK